jgi:hypothetical protein
MSVIHEAQVLPVRQRAICECGGELVSDGTSFLTHPPKYQHECEECGIKETFSVVYPRVVFKDFGRC